MTRRAFFCAYAGLAALRCTQMEDKDCRECEAKRRECEDRARRWVASNAFCDEQLRYLLNYIDYHRDRSERREWIEKLRKKIQWIIDHID